MNAATLERPADTRHATPDAQCVEAGDEYLRLTLRSYAAAMMSDHQIRGRILASLGLTEATVVNAQDDAAHVLAQHMAWAGESTNRIVEVLCSLSTLPAWPDDPEELTFIAKTAVREVA